MINFRSPLKGKAIKKAKECQDCNRYPFSQKVTAGKNKCKIIFGALLNFSFSQYCDSNIDLFTLNPHIVIALPTLQ